MASGTEGQRTWNGERGHRPAIALPIRIVTDPATNPIDLDVVRDRIMRTRGDVGETDAGAAQVLPLIWLRLSFAMGKTTC